MFIRSTFLNIFSIYLEAFKITKKNFFILIILFGSAYLFLSFLTYLSNLAISNIFIGIITSMLNIGFLFLFFLGISNIIYNIINGSGFVFYDLFTCWQKIPLTIIFYFLVFLFSYFHYKFFIFFATVSDFPDLFSFLWLFFIIFFFLFFLSFTHFLIIKYPLNLFNLVKYNFLLVYSKTVYVGLFFLGLLLINFIGLFFYYIGLFISIPFSLIAQAILFETLDS
jgi:hypothetical protein